MCIRDRHRPENVDDPAQLARLLDALGHAPAPVLLPMHPRTRAHAPGPPPNVRVIDPVPYRDFLALLESCALCVSDSGGVQEEASVVKAPVIVVRRSTERPEVLGTFVELVSEIAALGGAIAAAVAESAAWRLRLREIPSPYGDGTAAAATVEAIERHLAS